jgi:hypothetical protein
MMRPNVGRTCGGLAASFAAFAVLFLTPAPASAAQPEEAFLAGSLTSLRSGAVVVTFRGNEGKGDPEYAATAKLVRTPCPGRYRYLLESEAWPDGPSSVAAATVALSSRPGTEAAACGETPPRHAGHLEVTIAGSEEPLLLTGDRNGSGPFVGDLALGVEPRCDASYSFELEADLDGWHRDLRYRMDVLQVEITAQGHDEPRLSCSDAGP